MLWALSVLCLLVGLAFLAKYFYERKKQKEERGFVVILGTILLIWLFPGLGLIILAILLFSSLY